MMRKKEFWFWAGLQFLGASLADAFRVKMGTGVGKRRPYKRKVEGKRGRS